MVSGGAKPYHHSEADGNLRTIKLPIERTVRCDACSVTAKGGELKLCSGCGEVYIGLLTPSARPLHSPYLSPDL